MATAFKIPNEEEINSFLKMIFDNATVSLAKPVDGNAPGALIGRYIDDDDKAVAAFICDIKFAAFAGAALTMIPVGAAEDSIDEKRLEPTMIANCSEVVNMFSRFFMNQSTPHLRLDKCYSSDEAPDDIKSVIDAATDRVDVSIDIDRYGTGCVALLAV